MSTAAREAQVWSGHFIDGRSHYTREASSHGGRLATSVPFGGRCREGMRHVLWECEKWKFLRFLEERELELLADLPPAALLCGLALDSFTDRQKKVWMRVQEQ